MNLDFKIIIGIIVLILIIFVIALLATVSIKKKNRLTKLDNLQNRVDTLKALPVQYLLNKVNLMPKSDDVKEKFEGWVHTYHQLTKEDGEDIKKNISDIESLIYARKYKESNIKLNNLTNKIVAYESKYNNLLDELTVATQIDVKNREELTNQKELFRNYKKMYTTNTESYAPFNDAVERYFDNIKDSFANIDVLLNESQVDKAKLKAASLEGELLKIKDILNNLPILLEELRIELPKIFEEVEQRYKEVLAKKYHISHLDIPNRLKEVNSVINNALTKNNEVILDNIHDSIKDANSELNKIEKELDEEVRANEKLELSLKELSEKCADADKICKEANSEFQKVNLKYYILDNEEANLNMETNLLLNCIMRKNNIIAKFENDRFIASELNNQISVLLPRVDGLKIALNAYLNHLEELQIDEKRLLDQHDNMVYIIKDCEARLRLMNLPILSQAYYNSIEQCKDGVGQVDELLKATPLDINKTKIVCSEATDNVYKLYDNSRNLLKTAQMAENTITFANRYRSSYPEIETMLSRSEVFFGNGEYTKALSTAIEAVEFLHPEVKQELLEYRSKELKSSSYR
ncbi:MAG: septation ring formation regulator EzrA [Bacilli bacterium]|jgi:septation ring formation regulator EzrA|nr:septation ring formation regulator EzrA [Bacilli bacterium]